MSSVCVGGGACLGESPYQLVDAILPQALHRAALGSGKSLGEQDYSPHYPHNKAPISTNLHHKAPGHPH